MTGQQPERVFADALIQMGEEILDEIDAATFAELAARLQQPQWTEAEFERYAEAWRKACADPRALRRNRRENLRRNLSRRTRLALWRQHVTNSAFIWLTGRGRIGRAVARKLWRV